MATCIAPQAACARSCVARSRMPHVRAAARMPTIQAASRPPPQLPRRCCKAGRLQRAIGLCSAAGGGRQFGFRGGQRYLEGQTACRSAGRECALGARMRSWCY